MGGAGCEETVAHLLVVMPRSAAKLMAVFVSKNGDI
jgi:hypothetical protein